MAKCKKGTQAHLGIFRHNQEYQEIIQAYSKPCVTLAYLQPWYTPGIFSTISIFRTLAYSQAWYIQNPRIFRTLAY